MVEPVLSRSLQLQRSGSLHRDCRLSPAPWQAGATPGKNAIDFRSDPTLLFAAMKKISILVVGKRVGKAV
jgi:hypothetical protein